MFSYIRTSGLEKFPKNERFSKWKELHGSLMGKDKHYARTVWLFRLLQITYLVILIVQPIGEAVFKFLLGPWFHTLRGSNQLGISCVLISLGITCVQQHYQNKKIANLLSSH